MHPDNCTMRPADWPAPPPKGALGTELPKRAPAVWAKRRALRAKRKGR